MNYDESTNRRNNSIYIGIVAASLILVIILRICLMLENRRRDSLSPEKYGYEATIMESCDWVSSYLINLTFSYHCSLVASPSTVRLVTCQQSA